MERTTCAECGLSPANLRCTQCKSACYCSRDCQKANWKIHKKPCSLVQSQASPSPDAAAAISPPPPPPPPPSSPRSAADDHSAEAMIARVKAALGDKMPASLRDFKPATTRKQTPAEAPPPPTRQPQAAQPPKAVEPPPPPPQRVDDDDYDDYDDCDDGEEEDEAEEDEEDEGDAIRCAECGGRPANLRCVQCKCVYYCSRECQKANWKYHKKPCSSGQIAAMHAKNNYPEDEEEEEVEKEEKEEERGEDTNDVGDDDADADADAAAAPQPPPSAVVVAAAAAAPPPPIVAGAHRCLNCDLSPAKLRCSKCRCAFFCSQTCQKVAWPNHKVECGLAAAAAAAAAAVEPSDTANPNDPSTSTTKPSILDSLPNISDEGMPDSLREMLAVANSDGPLPTAPRKEYKKDPPRPVGPSKCEGCGSQPASLPCKFCLDTFYCTPDCQKAHWKNPTPYNNCAHKHRCDPPLPKRTFLQGDLPKSFAITEDLSDHIYVVNTPGLGYHSRARKRINEHEVFLQAPGLCAPVLMQKYMKEYCWHCFRSLPDDVKATAHKDDKLPPKILHCSPACRAKDIHYESEMKGIHHVHPQFPSAVVLLACRVLRLFVKDPSIKYRAECLLTLPTAPDAVLVKKRAELTYHFSHHSSLDTANARVAINLGLAWITKLIERLDLNGFQVSQTNGEYNLGMGVFDVAACLNHSCDANVINQFHMEEGKPPSMELKALKNIHRGKELAFSYVQVDSCTQNRREMLWEQYRFVCECSKCFDPILDAHCEGYKCQVPKCRGVGARFVPAPSPDNKNLSAKALSFDKAAMKKAPTLEPGVSPVSTRWCIECGSLGPFTVPRSLPTLKNGDVYWYVDKPPVHINNLTRVKLNQLFKDAHPKSAFHLAVGQQLLARILVKNDDTSNRDMLDAAFVQKSNVETSCYLHYQNHPLIHDEMDKFVQLKLKLTERKVKHELGIPDVPDWMLDLLAMAAGPMGGMF